MAKGGLYVTSRAFPRKRCSALSGGWPAAIPDVIVANYEGLIGCLDLPDLDDRHVLAAAIAGRADVIVTLNLKDFPASTLAPFNIEAQHPDEFIAHVLSLAPPVALGAIKEMRARLKRPPFSPEGFPNY